MAPTSSYHEPRNTYYNNMTHAPPVTAILTDDLLHHVISNFVGENMVDDTTLHSVMLVSTRWNLVANAQALWRQQTPPPLPTGKRQGSSAADERGRSLRRSLNLVSQTSGKHCLIGFQRLESCDGLSRSPKESRSILVERATEQEIYLAMNAPYVVPSFVFKELVAGRYGAGAAGGQGQRRRQKRGLTFWNHRLLRWRIPSNHFMALSYLESPTASETIAANTLIELKTKKRFSRHQSSYSGDGLSPLVMKTLSAEDVCDIIQKDFLPLEHVPHNDAMTSCCSYSGGERQQHDVIKSEAWARLVDWAMEMTQVFDLHPNAAFRAMAWFEQLLSNGTLCTKETKELQLAVGTLLYMAVNCGAPELVDKFSLVDAVFCARKTFTVNDCNVFLETAMSALDFYLARPTVLDFVEAYLRAMGIDRSPVASVVRFIAELALQTNITLQYRSSSIAACILSLGIYASRTDHDLWPLTLAQATGYKWSVLGECVTALVEAICENEGNTQLTMIRLRHASLGLLNIPRMRPFATLTAYRERMRSVLPGNYS